jgi:hypothetical protein
MPSGPGAELGILHGELEGLGKQEGAGPGRDRAREGAISSLDFVEQSVLGLRAEDGGGFRGV